MKCIFTVITWGKKAIDITGMFIQHCKEHNRKMQGNSCYLTKIFYRAQTKKNLWSLFMDAVQLSQGYRATTRKQFTFYHSVPMGSAYSVD